jgi:uncharacterized membrane protein
MKKMFFTVVIIAVFSVAVPHMIFADQDEHNRSVDAVLGQIRQEQNVSVNNRINADSVSDDLLEQLGEAVMSRAHPDQREHEWMDNMMGGEGSESLRSAHILMGYNYLTGKNYDTDWSMPMMGRFGGGWGMHPYFFGWGWLWMIIGLVVVVGGVAALVVVLNRRKPTTQSSAEILKARLARGEITKEEYDKLKQDVF